MHELIINGIKNSEILFDRKFKIFYDLMYHKNGDHPEHCCIPSCQREQYFKIRKLFVFVDGVGYKEIDVNENSEMIFQDEVEKQYLLDVSHEKV
jgi:hypothetical protein